MISYGSTGIFGLVGTKKAKIKVILPQEESAEHASQDDGPVIQSVPEKTPETAPDSETKSDEKTPLERRAAIDTGQRVLKKILEKITEDAVCETEEKEDVVLYKINGGNAALLIGKRGQTLEAIQYIVERCVNKHSEKRIRLQIDVGGYLENRKINLEQRAQRLAEKAKRIGKPVTVGEMNVYDRKIVHIALKDNRHVRTQSMGNGFYRKLVIFPKKGGGKKREKN